MPCPSFRPASQHLTSKNIAGVTRKIAYLRNSGFTEVHDMFAPQVRAMVSAGDCEQTGSGQGSNVKLEPQVDQARLQG